ncbi:MAG: ATP-grasp domain-containing protein [Bacteroidota bacterium]
MKKKKIFVIGLDKFNLGKLKNLPEAEECEFLPALKFDEIRGVEDYCIPDLIHKINKRIEKAGRIDAVVSYFDFPGSVLVPIIAEKYDLPGPGLENIMKCEHKYWSRREQQQVIPNNIPEFKLFDPYDKEAYDKINFTPPFWIKPIKSYHSYLAYRIKDKKHFYKCLKEVHEYIDYMVEPFTHIISEYDLPEHIKQLEDIMFAETEVSGRQCTVEGYIYDNQVMIYGLIDSINYENHPSFARYEYPSSLPYEIQYRMSELSRLVIEQIGLNNTAFNIEFFYDEDENQINLLEINPRMSQSHADMFEKIHGISHHHVMLNLALGRRPDPMEPAGKYEVASHFMYRYFNSGTVKKTPSEKEIEYVENKYPDMELKINVKKGMALDDLPDYYTDSYSYVLANIMLGGKSHEELLNKYNDVVNHLTFEIEDDK